MTQLDTPWSAEAAAREMQAEGGNLSGATVYYCQWHLDFLARHLQAAHDAGRPEAAAPWTKPYQIRLKKAVGQMPAGSIGTVVEHYADGNAAEVEFTIGTCFEDHEHCVETVEFADMEGAGRPAPSESDVEMVARAFLAAIDEDTYVGMFDSLTHQPNSLDEIVIDGTVDVLACIRAAFDALHPKTMIEALEDAEDRATMLEHCVGEMRGLLERYVAEYDGLSSRGLLTLQGEREGQIIIEARELIASLDAARTGAGKGKP